MKKILILAALCGVAAAPALANEANADKFFMKMDSNNDGKVTKAEHDSFTASKFNEADTNDDNTLSREEFMAHKRMHNEKDMSKTETDNNKDIKPN